MIRNVFLILIACVAGYLGFTIFDLYTTARALTDMPDGYVIGPADADLNVIEFMDYSCSYCREVQPTIVQAVELDGRVVYSPRPIVLGSEDAAYAALLAYAAGEQGKFIPMHNALMEGPWPPSESPEALAARLGLDAEALKADIEKEAQKDKVLVNIRLFKKLGGNATPTFIIGGKIFYVPEGGMPTVDDFLKMFAEARSK